jgi:hypothetical protein
MILLIHIAGLGPEASNLANHPPHGGWLAAGGGLDAGIISKR